MDAPPDDVSAQVCPWCSAELVAGSARCPSCGAILTSESEPQIPGVTTVIPAAPSQLAKAQKPNRLLRWISGEPSDEVTAPVPPPGSLAPPPSDVQREIRRLEIEAQLTNLSAEASAIAADHALEAREAHDDAGAAAALQVARDARAVSEAIDRADAEAGEAEPADGASTDTRAAVPVSDAPGAPASDASTGT